MNELTGLIDNSTSYSCTILNNEITCPSPEDKVFSVSCMDCIYCKDKSINHTRLKEIIPILLLRQEDE